ncbi:MAG TPA: amidohydrolase/deacetylase family metallohydrolase [Chloroflexota bacterium]|nr:amidohydrolase/deacetylase family metallohydrolase [Chloroflexota bacterium]
MLRHRPARRQNLAKYDVLLKGGSLIDPGQTIHARRDVAFSGGKVAAVGENLPAAEAERVVDASGKLVTPGMIDLHVHVYEGVSHYGIDPDPTCLAKGATTVMDAGSAGADTWFGFRKYVIGASATRIFAQLNISSMGMISEQIGELDELKWASVPRALEVIEKNRDRILGVKVRLTRDAIVGEAAGITPLHRAREAADAAGLPIMVHPQGAWCDSIDDILGLMRDRDILTHCFHGSTHGILDDSGKIRESVRRARDRGVIFDVGHGQGSFVWSIVESALAQGFAPTTISSDLHAHNVHGPVFDLATTVTKFLHLGMSLDEALALVTAVPARFLRMSDTLGTLAVGAGGDAVVFDLEEGAFELVDARGETRIGRQRLVPGVVIKNGGVYSEPVLVGN